MLSLALGRCRFARNLVNDDAGRPWLDAAMSASSKMASCLCLSGANADFMTALRQDPAPGGAKLGIHLQKPDKSVG